MEKQIEKELVDSADIEYDNLKDEYNCIKNEIREKIKIKEFIHTCTFYLRNTYKCAMTVFTILKKKLNEKNLMIFLIFGSLLAPFGSLLAPFGSLLAPFECQTSSKILFLFDLVSPFADVRNHFCKKVNVGTLSARTRIVGTPICGNPSLRPRAELCRRHLD